MWKQHNLRLALEPYGLANQRVCYSQMLVNIEQSDEQDWERSNDDWWIRTLNSEFKGAVGSRYRYAIKPESTTLYSKFTPLCVLLNWVNIYTNIIITIIIIIILL